MMRKLIEKLPLLSIILGSALAIAAAGILLTDGISALLAKKDPAAILSQAKELMPSPIDRVPEERGNNSMAAIEIDGVNVVGVLEVEKYQTTLPIAASWDTHLLSSLPCRFTGSIYDQTLIIGATDSQSQFDFATLLDVGDRMVLTDMEGGRYTYSVEIIHHAKHATLEKLQEGEYPLTIFVKNSKTSQYLLIRCRIGK